MKIFKCLAVLWILLAVNNAYAGTDTVCAEVRIEIRQELTLERQAFEAHMRITNGLEDIPLTNVNIDIYFQTQSGDYAIASSDEESLDADFFLKQPELINIDNANGGTIAGGATADLNWTIIPTKKGAGDNLDGTLYYVGAELSYEYNGIEEKVAVVPDFITVKPLPNLLLDYFLTKDIFADEPTTSEIEPIEPYTLGVRVKNNGFGYARNLTIDSAQPRIVENELGLLIDFSITGSFVGNQAAEPTLLLDFGDIDPDGSKVGRWIMESTLSGKFEEINARFSHASEYGGRLTSLIDDGAVQSHFLIRDVVADLPGRDSVNDFLAVETDGSELTLYESNGIDTSVQDVSSSANIQFTTTNVDGDYYAFSFTAVVGPGYAKVVDPFSGTKQVKQAIRSDGKIIPLDNAWFSKERNPGGDIDYYFNLFDMNTSGQYTLVFENTIDNPQPPVLQFIPDRQATVGSQVSFLVEASDPNGAAVTLTAENLPAGAVLNETDPGKALFDWVPSIGQEGSYEITYIASDGELSASRKAYITVNSIADSDGDGMDDAWEMLHFGTLDRDGTGDYDGDGVSDLDEFLNGTLPTIPNNFNVVFGTTTIDSNWTSISHEEFVNPVVILGVPTNNDRELGVARLRNRTSTGFEIAFQEWEYLDGQHAQETISYIVIEKGYHALVDGSVWVVGEFDTTSNENWETHAFPYPVANAPIVLTTLQTYNDTDAATVRVNAVDNTGFSAAIYEEEANTDHGPESVGYLAIVTGTGIGEIIFDDVSNAFSTSKVSVDHDGILLIDGVNTLVLQEERSQDDEVEHAQETVDVLTLNNTYFAQTVSRVENDAVALRLDDGTEPTRVDTPRVTPDILSEYNDPVDVTLVTDTAGADIYFTLDGSSPDPLINTNAILFTQPITITQSTVLTAQAFLVGYEASELVSFNYNFVNSPLAPVWDTIANQVSQEGALVTVVVSASDADGSIPVLSVDSSDLPGTPEFTDNNDGTGTFAWTTPIGSAGDYTVTFTASDESFVVAQDMMITVSAAANNAPVVALSSDAQSGQSPLTINFDASGSSDADGDPLSFAWDFDDGVTDTSGAIVSHEFTAAGVYNVSVAVSDGTDTVTDTIEITVTVDGGTGGVETVLTPTDDRYRWGTATSDLRADRWNHSFLKFDASELTSSINKAILRVYYLDADNVNFHVWRGDDDAWNETDGIPEQVGFSWQTEYLLATQTATAPGYVEFDV